MQNRVSASKESAECTTEADTSPDRVAVDAVQRVTEFQFCTWIYTIQRKIKIPIVVHYHIRMTTHIQVTVATYLNATACAKPRAREEIRVTNIFQRG